MAATLLVNSPQAKEFFDRAQLETGLTLLLGDPESADAHLKPNLLSSRIELRHAVNKVLGLVNDPTRNEVQKHEAAKKVADALTEKLTTARLYIEKHSEFLNTEAKRTADLALGPKSEKAGLHSEIRAWVREQAKTSDGLAKIREALKDSDELAEVIWHSPRYLLGLPEETHGHLRFEGLESRRPDLYRMFVDSMAFDKLASKHADTVRKVHTYFYNHGLADQASKRVEVG